MAKENIHRVVILGHNGFIGKHIERVFKTGSPEIEVIGKSYPELDLTRKEDVQSLCDVIDNNTVVIFCSGIKKQMGDTSEIFSQNIQMVINFSIMMEKCPVRRLVYFSSADVYGEDVQNISIDEETPVHPVSFYGIAKFASERILQKSIHGQEDSSLLLLRPPLVYGIGDTSRGYGPTGFAWAGVNQQGITLWGDGTERREFVCVEDLAEIVYRLTFLDYDGVVNVATGQSHDFKEVLDIIAKLLPVPLQISSRSRTKAKVDQGYKNHLLKNLLPDFEFTPLEEGIKQMITAMRE